MLHSQENEKQATENNKGEVLFLTIKPLVF